MSRRSERERERASFGGGAFGLATEETYLRAVDGREARPTRAVLTFVVGGETYGVDILSIREIIKLREVTEVPRTPRFLIGVISVRGSIIPVVDLRARLRLPVSEPTRAARILVVVQGGDPYGLLVDSVSGVVRLAESEIELPPSSFAIADGNFLSGIGRYRLGRRDKMVILLNLGQVVAFDMVVRGLRRRQATGPGDEHKDQTP
jgi:purine-binding chemotaxis protein CheW